MSRILIIEDDEDILDVLSYLLNEEGYELITSSDGDVAELVKKMKPDLILCDIWLPKKKGNEICRQMKADPGTKNIPFILISTSMNLRKIAMESGADDYIQKPFQINEVLNMVKEYI